MEQGGTTDLLDLGQDCVLDLLSRISPRDACRLSVVSSKFRSAADSDSTFAMEKRSGKKCYMIGAKELFFCSFGGTFKVIWPPLPESRFSEVAELLEMNWFEISGKMEARLLSPNTTYVAYLVFKIADNAEALGYNPVEMSVKLASGGRLEQGQMKYVCLTTPKEKDDNPWWPAPQWGVPEETEAYSLREPEEREARVVPKKRGDGWTEIEMGEFFNERSDDGVVEMSLKEVKNTSRLFDI
ncbi:hypothetical protein NE237_000165 [Protea cynaroides]|uniref:F-box domain-containing protein n=1 Tax=Protea cynaroides TaxID=273540 RepID=A0A9Q0GNE1_9MAGN|nr:hypothetical protein NE237_000165 [Protea cynaroides]